MIFFHMLLIFLALAFTGYGIFQSFFGSRESGNFFVTTGCFFLLLALLASSFVS